MNTATQLLNRCKTYFNASPCEPVEHPDEIKKDIESYLAKQPAEQKSISWLTVHAAVKEAISQCKDATGMPNQIDVLVNANQITHDAVDDFDETPEEHHKTASELKILRVLYSKCQEENLRLSLICEQKALEVMSDDDAKDAKRYQWLKTRLIGVDFDWQENGEVVIAFKWPINVGVGGNCDVNIDAAIEAHHGIK